MPIASEPGLHRPHPPITVEGLDPNDINPDWLDTMVKRLFTEVQRQLSQVESFKADSNTAVGEREKNARTLALLEQTLERLNKLDAERTAIRRSKGSKYDGSARKLLERKIARIVEAELAGALTEPARR